MIDVFNRRISRRTFLKASAAAGGTVAASTMFAQTASAWTYGESAPDDISGANVKWIRSSCMMCNSNCGIQVKVVSGVVEKIEGNPYSCLNNDVFGAAVSGEVVPSTISNPTTKGARICAKGNAGIMTMYSPYRLMKPLKRNGARGANSWEQISWLMAINNIAYGYDDSTGTNETTLPTDSGGTYTIRSQGASLAQIREPGQSGVTPPTGANAMPVGDVHSTIPNKPVTGGMAANRLVYGSGRDQYATIGNFRGNFGTKNGTSHESFCNSGWKISQDHSFTGSYGWKCALQAGTDGPNYMVLLGADFNEAWVPHVPLSRWNADFRRRGGTLVTSEVRVSQAAAKTSGTTRLIVKPGTDGALCNAILARWIDQATYASDFLKSLNPASLTALDGRPHTFVSDAALLVDTATGFKAGAGAAAREYLDNGTGVPPAGPTAVDTVAGAAVPQSQVVLDGEDGTKKTVFRLIKEALIAISGTTLDATVTTLAGECGFTDGGTEIRALADAMAAAAATNKLAVDGYRGVHAHTNGYQAMRAMWALNIFQDTFNRIGGVVRHKGAPGTSLGNPSAVGAPASSGAKLTRDTSGYNEDGTTKYGTEGVDYYTAADPRGLTAPRRWFPRTKRGNMQDTVASAVDGYPYKVKAWILIGGPNVLYTSSLGRDADNNHTDRLKETVGGVYKLPLLVAHTPTMDETAAHCDYVLPAVTYLERWGADGGGSPLIHHGYGGSMSGLGHIRRPVANWYANITIAANASRACGSPFTTPLSGAYATVDDYIDAWDGPVLEDDFSIFLGLKLGLPGYGVGAFTGSGADLGSGRGLNTSHFTAYMWHERKFTAGADWTGLNNDGSTGEPDEFAGAGDATNDRFLFMGGRWADPTDVEHATAGWAKNGQSGRCYLYLQQNAVNDYDASDNLPIRIDGVINVNGLPYAAAAEYDLNLITYKVGWHTQSRTTENKWLVGLTGRDRNAAGTEPNDLHGYPSIWIHPTAAAARGITDGCNVLITSSSNSVGVKAKAQVTANVHEECAVLDHHYSRRWFGSVIPSYNYKTWARDTSVDGDPRISSGATYTSVSEADPLLGDCGLTDPISAQLGYNDSKIKVERIYP